MTKEDLAFLALSCLAARKLLFPTRLDICAGVSLTKQKCPTVGRSISKRNSPRRPKFNFIIEWVYVKPGRSELQGSHLGAFSLGRRLSRKSRARKFQMKKLHHRGPNKSFKSRKAGCSSGQSSPQSSYNSLIFSSCGSDSSRSPLSSQNSIVSLSTTPPVPYIRPQPRIQVSSLLADTHTRSYHLEIVQHPLRTAEFGMANLSRLPLTPPIIARLTVRDPSGNSIIPEAELPFLIAHLSLYSGDGLSRLDMGSSIGRPQSDSPPILYGNLVSVVEQLEDLQGNMGLFFLFPDVSIRWRGTYQLGVSLSRISSPNPTVLAEHGTSLAHTRTVAFDAVPLSQYVAAPTTRLTQCFIRQGARMFVNTPYPASR